MKTYIYSIVILFLLLSCSKGNEKESDDFAISTPETYIKKFQNTKLMDSLKHGVFKGDTIAYEELKDIYYLSGYSKEFFFYSYYMAKNYKHIIAYDDCHFNLKHLSRENNDPVLDKMTEYFFLKVYENTPNRIESSVIKFYGDKTQIPKSDSILLINRVAPSHEQGQRDIERKE